AVSLLGLVALTQLGAAGWVFFQRFRVLAEKAGSPGQARSRTASTTGHEGSNDNGESLDPSDSFGTDFALATNLPAKRIGQPLRPEPVSPDALNPPPAPPENRFQELLQQGRALQGRGDMTTALIRFREAAALDPNNAELIAEIAITFERMNMLDRAAEQWKRIYDMGDAAGSYFIAAESRLKLSQVQALTSVQLAASAASGPISKLRDDAVLGLGEMAIENRPADGSLKRFALQVPIRARYGSSVDVRDVDIHVLFYDSIDEKTVVQTSANVRYQWDSSPIDWGTSAPEVLEVEYDAPIPLAKGPKAEERTYFGYVVRVYYRGELQDTVAEPESLNAKFPAPQFLDKSEPPK
ncbi:MAG: hypothetical protein ABI680_16580, partial [Chthoniobacteraceae bacterium]